MNSKEHWETVYATKQPAEVSWTQQYPATSLEFIRQSGLSISASIIDIGGGDSNLVDFLLEEGYKNVTVLDISENALERAKKRLGDNANLVQWIVSDITEFKPQTKYDLWHDRAAFHFLTTPMQIQRYKDIVNTAVNDTVVIGTFSTSGPLKCSGLEIQQYSEQALENLLSDEFVKQNCIFEDHQTPFDTFQNFLFCSFKRKSIL